MRLPSLEIRMIWSMRRPAVSLQIIVFWFLTNSMKALSDSQETSVVLPNIEMLHPRNKASFVKISSRVVWKSISC